jgi:hypothetical protein
MGNVTPKRQRVKLADKATFPTWRQWMGRDVDYYDTQTGAQRDVRCDYFDTLKSMGWRQGQAVPGLKNTGDDNQRQKPKAVKSDLKRARARLSARGY